MIATVFILGAIVEIKNNSKDTGVYVIIRLGDLKVD